MTARNDITGDVIATKGSNDAYRDGWDRIFGRKDEPKIVEMKMLKARNPEGAVTISFDETMTARIVDPK